MTSCVEISSTCDVKSRLSPTECTIKHVISIGCGNVGFSYTELNFTTPAGSWTGSLSGRITPGDTGAVIGGQKSSVEIKDQC
jgi:hypothetical protein